MSGTQIDMCVPGCYHQSMTQQQSTQQTQPRTNRDGSVCEWQGMTEETMSHPDSSNR